MTVNRITVDQWNQWMLEAANESGVTIRALGVQAGINRETWRIRMKGVREIPRPFASEVIAIARHHGLSGAVMREGLLICSQLGDSNAELIIEAVGADSWDSMAVVS